MIDQFARVVITQSLQMEYLNRASLNYVKDVAAQAGQREWRRRIRKQAGDFAT